MKNKKVLFTLSNGFEVIDAEDIFGNNVRVLASKKIIYSSTLINNKFAIYYDYQNFFDFPIQLNPNIKNTLVLGAGCFTYPKYYISTYKDKNMDAVEIDSEIIDVAHKYFFLDELFQQYDKKKKRLKIFNMDAYEYVSTCQKTYDNIFIDIFNDDEPIDLFLKDEFLNKITHILLKRGIFSINYIINQGKEKKFKDYLDSLSSHFKYINLFALNDKFYFNNNHGNIYILCSNYKYDIDIGDPNILLIDKNTF